MLKYGHMEFLKMFAMTTCRPLLTSMSELVSDDTLCKMYMIIYLHLSRRESYLSQPGDR